MAQNFTEAWKKLFKESCQGWDPRDIQRFLNIPNDPEEVDAEEYAACKELVAEVRARKAKKAG